MHKYKKILENTAIDNLQQMFKGVISDSIFYEDALKQWGRETNNKNNKKWLGVKLMQWKDFDLAEGIYSLKAGHRSLEGIKLTSKGRGVLGMSYAGYSEKLDSGDNLKNIMSLISNLRKEHPEYEITFDIKLKTH